MAGTGLGSALVRSGRLALLALASAGAALAGAQPPAARAPAAQGPQGPQGPQAAQRAQGSLGSPGDLRRQLDLVRRDPNAISLPPSDSIRVGAHVVPAGTRVPGTVAVARGNLDVHGTIEGNAIAVNGDVIVHPGGRITGSALSVFGKVRLEGGTVDGEMRALSGIIGPVPRPAAVRQSGWDATFQSLKVALGWLAVLLVIGIGVLMFASAYLDGVVDSLERNFVRSFWVGLAGQLGILPVLLLLLVGLALTIIGALLIPFAIVAYAIGVAGLLTLGFLATAQVTGHSLLRAGQRALSERGSALRALVLGVLVFVGLWIVAAALSWLPVVSPILRGIALLLTWVAATAGFGAAIRSRAGARRDEEPARAPVRSMPEDSMAWQTPTPVTGVVAARRPTPAPHAYNDYR